MLLWLVLRIRILRIPFDASKILTPTDRSLLAKEDKKAQVDPEPEEEPDQAATREERQVTGEADVEMNEELVIDSEEKGEKIGWSPKWITQRSSHFWPCIREKPYSTDWPSGPSFFTKRHISIDNTKVDLCVVSKCKSFRYFIHATHFPYQANLRNVWKKNEKNEIARSNSKPYL